MRGLKYLILFLFLLTVSTSAFGDVIDVSQPVQVTSDTYYERGQAIVFDGTSYWLFYGRSASVTGNYQNGNPDTHDYQVYYKKAATVEGLTTALATAVPGAVNSFLGEIGAVVFNGDVWVFATIDTDLGSTGTHAELHGWWTGDDGANWNQVGPIISGLSDGQAHHDEYVFEGDIWIVEGSGNFTTIHSSTPKTGGWSSPVTVGSLTGGLAHFFYEDLNAKAPGEELYLALFSAGNNYIFHWDKIAMTWDLIDQAVSSGWDPTLFQVEDTYVFAQAPWIDESGGRQSLVYWSGNSLGGLLSGGSSMMACEGRYGTNTWTDMWPIGFTDNNGDSYLFFTSERDLPDQEGTGNIWFLKVDWDLTRDHYTYIQEAIDGASGGDEVHLMADTYTAYDRALAVVDKPLTLYGDGQTDDEFGTILDGGTYGTGPDNAGLGNNWPRAIVVQSDNVTIRDMRIKGFQGDNISYGGYAAVGRVGSGWGVAETSIDNWTVRDLTMDDCLYGIRGQGLTGMVIQGTTYEINSGAADYAAYITTSENTLISSNTMDQGAIWVTDATGAVIGGPNPSDGNILTNINYNGIWYGQQFAAGTSSENGLIQNNDIDGAAEGGIVVWNWPGEVADNIRILDNYITNADGGSDEHGGISIYQGVFTNLEIKGNVSTANAGDQPGLLLSSNTLTSASITNNEFTDNPAEGIRIYNVTRGEVGINENIITGNTTGVTMTAGSTTTLDLSANWWGDNDPAVILTMIQPGMDYTPWLDVGTDTDPGAQGFQPDKSVLWVDDDSPQAGALDRIQEGVNRVSGSTVNVLDGTYYTDGIYVDNPVEIIGQSRAGVVIAPLNAYVEGTNDNSAFIYRSSDVTIETMTIDGQANGSLGAGVNNFRIGVTADYIGNYSNIVLDDLTIQNIGRRAVQIANPAPPVTGGHVINNCLIQNIDQSGAMTTWYTNCTITNNTFGPATGNRIQNVYGHVEVHDNIIDASNATFGIVAYTADPVDYRGSVNATGNTINNAFYAIAVQGDAVIEDNQINVTVDGGIGIFSAGDYYPVPNDFEARNNVINVDVADGTGMNLVNLLDGNVIGGPNTADRNIINLTVPPKETVQPSSADFVHAIGGPDDAGALLASKGSRGAGSVGALIWWMAPGNAFTLQNNQFNCAGNNTGVWVFHLEDPTAITTIEGNEIVTTSATSSDPLEAAGVFVTDDGSYLGDENGECYADVVGNTITGFVNGVYYYAPAGRDVGGSVTGNDISGGVTGIRIDGSAGFTTIEENKLSGNTGDAVYLAGTAPMGTIFGNDLSGVGGLGLNNTTGTDVDASGNWWGDYDPILMSGFLSANVDYTPWLEKGTDLYPTTIGFQGDFADLWVDDDSPQVSTVTRVREGVDMVTGSTVNVAAGTYIEQVSIDKDMTLIGAGVGNTIIQSPATLTEYFTSGSNDNYPVIYAHDADDINIEAITLDGDGQGDGNVRFTGIGYWNAGGSVLNTHITRVRNATFSGAQHGVSIYTSNNTGGPYTLDITGVSIDDMQKNGMALLGDGLTVNVSNCSVTGNGATTVTAQNGIQIGYGAGGTVSDCTIDGIAYTGGTWAATAFLFLQGSSVDLTGNNVVTNSQTNVSFEETNGSVSGLTVTTSGVVSEEGISIRDYGAAKNEAVALGMKPAAPFDAELAGNTHSKLTPTAVTIDNVTLTGVDYAGSYGIAAWALGEDVTVDITNSDLSGWEYGVVAYEDASVATVNASHNDFNGNLYAVYSNTAVTQNFEENFWGEMSCAAIAPLIEGIVDYDPWCNDDFSYCAFSCNVTEVWVDIDDYCDGCPNDGHVWGYDAFATITDGIAGLSTSGGTVHVGGGAYTETTSAGLDNLTLDGDELDIPQLTAGLILDNVTGLTVQDLDISGNGGAPSHNTVIMMNGVLTDLTLDNCIVDGELIADRNGISRGQLEGDVSITNSEFKNVLGWALIDSRSGSGGDGSAMGTITFSGNNVHDCNGSVAFRGLSTDRTDLVNVFDNTWNTIGGVNGEQGQHWAAFEVNRSVNVNVYNNEISHVLEGEWGEGQALQFWDIDNLDVYDNTITDNFQGIFVYGGSGAFAVPGGSVHDNSFMNNSDYNLSVDATATGGPLNAENDYWGTVNCPGVAAAIDGAVDFEPWCNEDFTYCSFTCAPVNVVWIDDDWTGSGDGADLGAGKLFGYNAFDVIQNGVEVVTDNGTINVMDGFYTNPIDIDARTDLTFNGETQAGTIFQPTSVLNWDVGGYGSSRKAAVRMVESADITFDNMTLDFDLIRGNNIFGLFFWNTTGVISNNILENMDVADASGGYYELTSYIRAPGYTDAARAEVSFLNNTFLKPGRVAVAAHDFSHVIITGNTFDKVDSDFGYGVEVGSEATGVVSDNVFRNYNTWALTDQSGSAAIYVENAFTAGEGHTGLNKQVMVSDNEIYSCQYGLYVGNSYPGFSGDVDINLTVEDNYIHDNATTGSESSGGMVIVDEGKDLGSSVNVTATNNKIENNGDHGIYIYTNGNGDITAAITSNQLLENFTGMAVKDFGAPSNSSYNLGVSRNIFMNNLNAEDDAAGGFWDDGVSEGNCWDDYESNPGYPGQYIIPGSAGSVDSYPNVDCGPLFGCEPGEVNGDGIINLLDILYLIEYKFKSGPAPQPFEVCSGDVDCNCVVNLLDILYLIEYKFKEGPPPCSNDTWVANCGSVKGASVEPVSPAVPQTPKETVNFKATAFK